MDLIFYMLMNLHVEEKVFSAIEFKSIPKKKMYYCGNLTSFQTGHTIFQKKKKNKKQLEKAIFQRRPINYMGEVLKR